MDRLERAKELGPITSAEAPSLAAMTKPPTDAAERDNIGRQMWGALSFIFESSLSEQDKALWKSPPSDPSQSPEHLRLLHTFDNFILSQFSVWGWRLLMSVEVLQRVSEWEKHDPTLLARLGKEMELRSRVLRGEKSAPLGDGVEAFADGAIEELTRLLRRQREQLHARRGASCEAIADWMRSEIGTRPDEFPLLRGNLEQLHGFVHTLPRSNATAARAFRRGDLGARGFFILWFALTHNRSVKDVQNMISARRAARRRS